MAETNHPNQTPLKAGRKRPLARRIALLVLTAGIAIVIVFSLSWWEERLLVKAEEALDRENRELALKYTAQFLTEHPEHPGALALRARALIAMPDPASVSEGIRLMEKVGPATAKDLHALARGYMGHRNWSKALPLLVTAQQQAPQNEDILYELTSCRSQLGLLHEALDSAQRFAAMPGNEARGYHFVGTIHQDLAQFQDAAEAYAKALEFEPQGENLPVSPQEFFLRYGLTHLELGQPKQAIQLLEKSLMEKPTAQAHYLLGNAFSHLGETEKAQKSWEAAVDLDRWHHRARESLANLAIQRKNSEEALRRLKPLRQSPAMTSRTAFLLERAYTFAGNETEAAVWRDRAAGLRRQERRGDALASIVNTTPHSYWAKVIKAYRFAQKQNWAEADVYVSDIENRKPLSPFVADLVQAISQRGTLPSLDRFPLEQN